MKYTSSYSFLLPSFQQLLDILYDFLWFFQTVIRYRKLNRNSSICDSINFFFISIEWRNERLESSWRRAAGQKTMHGRTLANWLSGHYSSLPIKIGQSSRKRKRGRVAVVDAERPRALRGSGGDSYDEKKMKTKVEDPPWPRQTNRSTVVAPMTTRQQQQNQQPSEDGSD